MCYFLLVYMFVSYLDYYSNTLYNTLDFKYLCNYNSHVVTNQLNIYKTLENFYNNLSLINNTKNRLNLIRKLSACKY